MNILDIYYHHHTELFFLLPTKSFIPKMSNNPSLKHQASKSLPLISRSLFKENFLLQYMCRVGWFSIFVFFNQDEISSTIRKFL